MIGTASGGTLSTSPRPRVLVAEDDREMRRLVIDSLRRGGYDVVDVTDGGQLLLRITDFYRLRPAAAAIDLIVSDIRMPVVSGLSSDSISLKASGTAVRSASDMM